MRRLAWILGASLLGLGTASCGSSPRERTVPTVSGAQPFDPEPALPKGLAEDYSAGTRPASQGQEFGACPFLPLRLQWVDHFESPSNRQHWEFVTLEMEIHLEAPAWPEKKADYGLYASPIK